MREIASVTYIAGCTDATYSSSKCPHKAGYPDQQWVALARCDGDDIGIFSGCAHHKDEIAINHEDCTCDAASALISNPIKGQPTLNQIALLPTTIGGTISFNPTALPTAAASSHHSGSGGSLSTSAKAGIGVGVGVGVSVIAAMLFMFFFQRRRQLKKRLGQEQQQEQGQQRLASEHPPKVAAPSGEGTGNGPTGSMQQQQRSPPPMYSPDSQHARDGWLRFKPELHGESAQKVELAGDYSADMQEKDGRDDHHYHEIGDGRGGNVDRMNSIQKTPFESYPPGEFAAVDHQRLSDTPSLPPVISPQSTGGTEVSSPTGPRSGQQHQRTGSSNMDPISEYRIDGGAHHS